MRKSEIAKHYKDIILPYWNNLRDDVHGGFYGFVDHDLKIYKEEEKGVILNSRILWFYSEAFLTFGDTAALDYAKHAYEFLVAHCMDQKEQGVYWMLHYDGSVKEDMKHTYNQAFAIYALATYYEASKNEEALHHALDLFHLVESKCRDEYGYLEAFTVDWKLIDNDKLSENGLMADKTMNTLLHVLEAYTQLYKVTKNNEVKDRLVDILHVFKDQVYNPELKRLEVFYDVKMNSIANLQSYGHDIEASWLLDRACEVIGDESLAKMTQSYTSTIVETIYERAYDHGAMLNESFNEEVDHTRIWWVQAESVVGFYNGYQYTGNKKYKDAANAIWSFIQDKLVDHRPGSEWFWSLDENNQPIMEKPITEPWKCPYHNGRMCFEMIRRIAEFEDRRDRVIESYHNTIHQKNEINENFYNGIYDRYKNPVLTRNHIPYFWKYDMNQKTNPYFMERLGVNATFNSGAIYLNGKYYLLARVEGNDRKSFFAVAESENGVDGFKFWDFPVELPDTEPNETNVYDMRLTQHEDGYIYGVFCSESKDLTSKSLSAANAAAGIVRTKDLKQWERLPNLKTISPQQRNVVLHPEFVEGKYAFYTRPQDDFINTGSGGGVGFALCDDINQPSIGEERIISKRKYHTITEEKNGAGAVPIKTDKGWIHVAHGVRNTAAGLRYVIYVFATDLEKPWEIIAEPSGFFIAPLGSERVGDVSNVTFINGAIVNEKNEVYLYYASSDTRLHVATTSIEQLVDYTFSTPEDPLRSVDCVKQRCEFIRQNLSYMENGR